MAKRQHHVQIRLVSSGKAAMCTGTEMDWNLIDSDHAGVKIWLDILCSGFFPKMPC